MEGISHGGEIDGGSISYLPDDGWTGVDADADSEWLLQLLRKNLAQVVDVAQDLSGCREGGSQAVLSPGISANERYDAISRNRLGTPRRARWTCA
jgi:hypothetical protein